MLLFVAGRLAAELFLTRISLAGAILFLWGPATCAGSRFRWCCCCSRFRFRERVQKRHQ